MTVALPQREIKDTQNKIFLVDAPKELEKFLPAEILSNAVRTTHISYEPFKDPRKVAKDMYNRYINEASLVITKLLHAAIPCLAFGIPVIRV